MEQISTADSLRELADFIENHRRFEGALDHRFLHFMGDAGSFAAAVAELGGSREKSTTGADGEYFGVSRWFGRIELFVYTTRETVCEARVVGTERVLVPDPDAPKIEVERNIIEWTCAESILKGVTR